MMVLAAAPSLLLLFHESCVCAVVDAGDCHGHGMVMVMLQCEFLWGAHVDVQMFNHYGLCLSV